MTAFKSDFLNVLQSRGFIHQISDPDSLDALALAVSASAQNVYAALHGTVTDATGSALPNATVTVLNTSTGISTVRQADASGYYIFTQLQVGGPYTVTIASSGFESYVETGLTLNVNSNREVDGHQAIRTPRPPQDEH